MKQFVSSILFRIFVLACVMLTADVARSQQRADSNSGKRPSGPLNAQTPPALRARRLHRMRRLLRTHRLRFRRMPKSLASKSKTPRIRVKRRR